MPLGDESFYTVDGEEINRTVLVQHMIDLYNEKYPDSQITDFNEGSEIRNIIESLACDIFHLELDNQSILRACFLSTSYGRWLDLFGEELNTPRDYGSISTGNVVFTIPEPATQEVTIPDGTILLDSETGIEFATNGEVIIAIGETNVTASIQSVIIGVGANSRADKITVFRDNPPVNGLTVTNPEPVTGGRNAEIDEDYRNRLLQVRAEDNFGSIQYYINLGESVDGVHDIILSDSEDYTAKIIVNGNAKPLPNDVLANVATKYLDTSNIVYNHSFEVESVDYTDFNLEVEISVKEEIDEDIITDILEVFFDGGDYTLLSTAGNVLISNNGLNINDPVSKYQLITAIEEFPAVLQVTSMTSNEENFNKVTPDTDTVFKLGTVSITQNVEE